MSSLESPIAAGRTAEIFAWENGCILKLIRPGFPPHLADQEWQHAEAAWKLGAPAPRPVELIEVDGRRGVVFQRLTGPNMSQAMQRSPWRIGQYARLLGRMHAGLHRISTPTFPGLPGRVRWNLNQAALLSEARKAAVLRLLDDMPDEETLCHGDFHPENILLTAGGPLVIDWEGSMHGSRAGDAATTCLWIRQVFQFGKGWLYRQIGLRFEQNYLSEYQRVRGPLDHLQEWIAILAACRMTEENRSAFHYLDAMIRHTIP